MKVLYYLIFASILWVAKHKCNEFDHIYLTENQIVLEYASGSYNLRFGIVHPDHEVYFSLTPQFTSLVPDDSYGSLSSFQKHWHYLGENIAASVININKKLLLALYKHDGHLYKVETTDQPNSVLVLTSLSDPPELWGSDSTEEMNFLISRSDFLPAQKRSSMHVSQLTCTPNCVNRTCGGDGCGGVCGSCSGFDICTEVGHCANNCASECLTNQCTVDHCGNICSKCSTPQFCNLMTSSCETSANPDIATVLSFHNRYRSRHGLSPLSWSTTLANSASSWANSCTFGHSPTFFGENVAISPGSSYSYQSALTDWIKEERRYDCENDVCVSDFTCLNFRQMVWDETTEVGCARVVCSQNSPFPNVAYWTNIVCHYSPIGNIIGRRPFPEASCRNQGCTAAIACASQSRECGFIFDGCSTRSCGTCSSDPSLCNESSGLCGCFPTTTCENTGQACGNLFDGCSTISCGPACPPGTPECSPLIPEEQLPQVCQAQEKVCGEVTNGCATHVCGTCDIGSSCQLGQCVPCTSCPRYSTCENQRCVCMPGFVKQGSVCEIVTDNPQWSFFTLLGDDNWTILPLLRVNNVPRGEIHQLTQSSTDPQILAWLNTHRLTTVANVSLSATILPQGSATEWGLVWRSFDLNEGRGLQFMSFTFALTDQKRGEFRFNIRVNDTFTRSFSSNFSPFLQGMSWDTNVGNRMQVVVQGKTYEFYLDGVLISEPVTMDHLPLGGYFGLFSRGPSIFRDIRLNTFSDLEIKVANCMNVTLFVSRLAHVLRIDPKNILMDRFTADGCTGNEISNIFDVKLLGSNRGTSAALVSSLRTMIAENSPVLRANNLIVIDLFINNRFTPPNTFDLFGVENSPSNSPNFQPNSGGQLSTAELVAIIVASSLAGICSIAFVIVCVRIKRGQHVPLLSKKNSGNGLEMSTYERLED